MVELTNENSLLQKIGDLAANGKIQSTVGLTAQQAETKIQKLIPTTHQRLNAARFYLDLMGSVDYTPYIVSKFSLSTEQKPLTVDFVNESYRLIERKLQHSGVLPV